MTSFLSFRRFSENLTSDFDPEFNVELESFKDESLNLSKQLKDSHPLWLSMKQLVAEMLQTHTHSPAKTNITSLRLTQRELIMLTWCSLVGGCRYGNTFVWLIELLSLIWYPEIYIYLKRFSAEKWSYSYYSYLRAFTIWPVQTAVEQFIEAGGLLLLRGELGACRFPLQTSLA